MARVSLSDATKEAPSRAGLGPLSAAELVEYAEFKRLHAKRLSKVLETMNQFVRQAHDSNCCVICILVDDSRLGLPLRTSLLNHRFPFDCPAAAQDDAFPSFANPGPYHQGFKTPVNRAFTCLRRGGSLNEYCWKCLQPKDLDIPGVHGEGNQSTRCIYDDVAKPLLYSLCFLDVPRSIVMRKVDPNFFQAVSLGDYRSYANWLMQRTDGNILFNFQEVLYQIGLYRQMFQE